MTSPGDDPDPLRATLARALGTHYRVDRLLGRGGMGAVYLAHEAGLDREVAIKVLPPERASDEAGRERFRREARTAAGLGHPNIVPLHTFGTLEDTAYYVMGYVKGESLAARLAREGPLPEDEARRILVAVADALHFAHGQGVVHRDVKPDNVLLEASTGRVLLTDFGIARAEGGGSLTDTGAIVGTPDFMSPEQAAGRPDVDARSDVYSLGVMAYKMLSGRLPFEAASPAQAVARRLTEDPVPLGSVAPQVSEAAVLAVMRCLSRDPARRWPDALSFGRALPAPGVDDDGVPRGLRPAASHGLLALALGYYGLVARAIAADVPQPGLILETAAGALPALAALFLVLPLIGAAQEWARSGACALAWRVALLEPTFWTTWYPRPLRRPGNVWERLPQAVRAVRAAFGVLAAVALGYLAPCWVWLFQWDHRDPDVAALITASRLQALTLPLTVPLSFGAAFAVLALALATSWLGNRLGLDSEEGSLFVFGAGLSNRAFWNRPAVAALLAPGGRSLRPTAGLPDDVAAHWPAGDAAPIPREEALLLARQAAEQALAEERDAARLQRGFDPHEVARLEGRLRSLGEATPGEPPHHTRLRELLARQLELGQAAGRQIADALARRDRLRDRLVALCDEAVRAGARPESQRGRLEARLRALRAELAPVETEAPTATRMDPPGRSRTAQ